MYMYAYIKYVPGTYKCNINIRTPRIGGHHMAGTWRSSSAAQLIAGVKNGLAFTCTPMSDVVRARRHSGACIASIA